MFLYAFGLIELFGDDLRAVPVEFRKATLANVLAGDWPSHLVQCHVEDNDETGSTCAVLH